MEFIVHPRILLQRLYSADEYRPHIERVCTHFACTDILASIAMQHKQFHDILIDVNIQNSFLTNGKLKIDGTRVESSRLSWIQPWA